MNGAAWGGSMLIGLLGGLLFLAGFALVVLGMVAVMRPLPKLGLRTRGYAVLAVLAGLGSCVGGGSLLPEPTPEQRARWEQERLGQEEARAAAAAVRTDKQAADPRHRPQNPGAQTSSSAAEEFASWQPPEGIVPGSPAARALYDLEQTPASNEDRADLERQRRPGELAAKWTGIPAAVLGDCSSRRPRDGMCVVSQLGFIEDWPLAWKGDYQAQKEVAHCLRGGCSGAVMISPIQACSWRIVIASSGSPLVDGSDAQNAERHCASLRAEDLQAARASAATIQNRIHSDG